MGWFTLVNFCATHSRAVFGATVVPTSFQIHQYYFLMHQHYFFMHHINHLGLPSFSFRPRILQSNTLLFFLQSTPSPKSHFTLKLRSVSGCVKPRALELGVGRGLSVFVHEAGVQRSALLLLHFGGMEFSDTYKHSGHCVFSPNARFLAVAVDYRLVIRDVVSLKVVQLYSCLDKISYVEWAPDSEYILCGLFKKAMVQAWSVSQPEWTCKIDDGAAGICHARWSPDSRHILTTSDFQLRLTVWSLVSTACVHVPWPKHGSRAVAFTRDGKFAAIATRRDCKDYINMLACRGWEAMGTFGADTVDLADLEWSPTDSNIAVWDSPLEYKVLVYSPDGRCLFRYSAYENALGLKTVAWSPCGQFLGCGSYDQVVRALNHLTFKPVVEFSHPFAVKGISNAVVFKEIEEAWHADMQSMFMNRAAGAGEMAMIRDTPNDNRTRVRYKVAEVPISIPSQKPLPDKPNPKQGIGLMAWSADSHYLFTRNDNMPTALWIWDIARLELAALLIHKDPIRAAAWDPMFPRVAICTGTPQLYMWTPSGAACVNIPLSQFVVLDLKWNPDGSSLVLKDKEAFCCTFVPMLAELEVDDEQF